MLPGKMGDAFANNDSPKRALIDMKVDSRIHVVYRLRDVRELAEGMGFPFGSSEVF